MTTTVGRVAPQPRGILSAEDQVRLTQAAEARAEADAEMRRAVLVAVSRGASVRELAAFTGLSTNTISRWKREK
jgi:ATP-dependent exoDNAse (exonuclease V) alpha subunit